MTTLFNQRFFIEKPDRSNLLMAGFVAAWILSMIALPISRWVFGDVALTWGVLAAALFQVTAVFVILMQAWGAGRALSTMAVIGLLTWLAETIGSTTGFPFGYYHYTDLLQPQVAGVPLLIPLAWYMMLPPAWAVAQVISGRHNRLVFTLISAVALTAWDLFLDPQKVAWGFWVWTDSSRLLAYSGGYFGIPWVNFVGWVLVAALVTWVVNPPQVPVRPLLVIYGIVWIFQTVGQLVFWNQPGPALVGFVAMGLFLAAAWTAPRERWL